MIGLESDQVEYLVEMLSNQGENEVVKAAELPPMVQVIDCAIEQLLVNYQDIDDKKPLKPESRNLHWKKMDTADYITILFQTPKRL